MNRAAGEPDASSVTPDEAKQPSGNRGERAHHPAVLCLSAIATAFGVWICVVTLDDLITESKLRRTGVSAKATITDRSDTGVRYSFSVGPSHRTYHAREFLGVEPWTSIETLPADANTVDVIYLPSDPLRNRARDAPRGYGDAVVGLFIGGVPLALVLGSSLRRTRDLLTPWLVLVGCGLVIGGGIGLGVALLQERFRVSLASGRLLAAVFMAVGSIDATAWSSGVIGTGLIFWRSTKRFWIGAAVVFLLTALRNVAQVYMRVSAP